MCESSHNHQFWCLYSYLISANASCLISIRRNRNCFSRPMKSHGFPQSPIKPLVPTDVLLFNHVDSLPTQIHLLHRLSPANTNLASFRSLTMDTISVFRTYYNFVLFLVVHQTRPLSSEFRLIASHVGPRRCGVSIENQILATACSTSTWCIPSPVPSLLRPSLVPVDRRVGSSLIRWFFAFLTWQRTRSASFILSSHRRTHSSFFCSACSSPRPRSPVPATWLILRLLSWTRDRRRHHLSLTCSMLVRFRPPARPSRPLNVIVFSSIMTTLTSLAAGSFDFKFSSLLFHHFRATSTLSSSRDQLSKNTSSLPVSRLYVLFAPFRLVFPHIHFALHFHFEMYFLHLPSSLECSSSFKFVFDFQKRNRVDFQAVLRH